MSHAKQISIKNLKLLKNLKFLRLKYNWNKQKHSLEGVNSRSEVTEDRFGKLENTSIEIIQSKKIERKKNKEKWMEPQRSLKTHEAYKNMPNESLRWKKRKGEEKIC